MQGHESRGIEPDELGAVWKALANEVRRAILDCLRNGPRTTGELSDQFSEYSRFAVMQHLRVLESANLILIRREGRKRYNYLNPVPIQQLYQRWVSDYMQPWTKALVGLKRELESREDSA